MDALHNGLPAAPGLAQEKHVLSAVELASPELSLVNFLDASAYPLPDLPLFSCSQHGVIGFCYILAYSNHATLPFACAE